MRRPEFIARQAGNPSGFIGRLIAAVMERETARVNERAVSLLRLRPQDRVIDVGTGHGRTLGLLAAVADQGLVVGVDHSAVMCARARHNNRGLVDKGRVKVEQASSDRLPYEAATFDAAISVHTLYFWDPAGPHLSEVARVLRPGGRFVMAFRPIGHPQVDAFPASVYRFRSVQEVEGLLRTAGFRPTGNDRDERDIVLATAERGS